jgi:hypothetical protein
MLIVGFGGAWDDDVTPGKGMTEKLKTILGANRNLKSAQEHFFRHDAVALAEPRYFTWEDQDEAVTLILERARHSDVLPLCLLGHSFGGDTVANVADELARRAPHLAIDLLITLDAVGARGPNLRTVMRGRQRARPATVKKWINVWAQWEPLNLRMAANPRNFMRTVWTNLVARAGGHWGMQDAADTNVPMGHGVYHNEALTMLLRVQDDIHAFLLSGKDRLLEGKSGFPA